MFAAIAFLVGWRTRAATAAQWVFVWSLFERNPALLDGGDNLLRLVLVFMLLIDAGSHLSVDVRRAGHAR